MSKRQTSGFTLIELSLVLVIIGFIAGGILLGRDMIRAASLRSLISQIDQLKIATNSFKNKYGSLPGDMHPSQTAKFGMFTFTGADAGTPAYGDNNGLVWGSPEAYCAAECGAFWRHLSDAGLLASQYGKTLETNTLPGYPGAAGGTPMGETQWTGFTSALYMPASKGSFGFVGAGSMVVSYMANITEINQSQNLFFVVPAAKASRFSYAEPSLSPMDSYSIDSKVDDGKPSAGKFIVSVFSILPIIPGNNYYWSNGTVEYGGNPLDSNSKVCTVGGADALAPDVHYNANPTTGGSNVTCIPLFLW